MSPSTLEQSTRCRNFFGSETRFSVRSLNINSSRELSARFFVFFEKIANQPSPVLMMLVPLIPILCAALLFRTLYYIVFKNTSLSLLHGDKQEPDSLFISHFLPRNISQPIPDPFFGDLRQILDKDFGEDTQVLFLGHSSKKLNKNNLKLLSVKMFPSRKLALSGLRDLTGFSLTVFLYFLYALFNRKRSKEEKILLALSVIDCYSPSTFLNEFFARCVIHSVKISKPKKLFLTLEGHPFEVRSIRILLNLYPDLLIFSRQIALLESHLYGIEQLSMLLSDNYKFLLMGHCYKVHFSRHYPNCDSFTFVIGSARFNFEGASISPAFHQGQYLLFCPEGISKQVDTFTSLARDVAKEYGHKILFRFHPDTAEDDVCVAGARMSPQELITISKNRSLEEDLLAAKVVVFQKSSVALYALADEIPLVFLAEPSMEISPLRICKHVKDFTVSNAAQLNDLITDYLDDHISTSPQGPLVKHFSAEIDIGELRNVLGV